MDANLDNHYDGNEMSTVINTAKSEFIAIGEDIIDISTRFNNITNDDFEIDSGNNSSTNKKCGECEKTATRTYTNPFSGQKEYYCQTHYNKLLDMIGGMEEDVGNGSYSKHTCEECNKEGTHSIIGFSGKIEYYCTQHYNELKELLDKLG